MRCRRCRRRTPQVQERLGPHQARPRCVQCTKGGRDGFGGRITKQGRQLVSHHTLQPKWQHNFCESQSRNVYQALNLSQLVPTAEQQRLASESLYRDANTLLYADNKPSEEVIDRLIGKINKEYVLAVRQLLRVLAERLVASTRRASSRGNGKTRTRETSRTSTSAIACLTRRSVVACSPRMPTNITYRSRDTTTSTRRRSEPASSVAPHYDSTCFRLFRLWTCRLLPLQLAPSFVHRLIADPTTMDTECSWYE